jgi:hypothetical protein
VLAALGLQVSYWATGLVEATWFVVYRDALALRPERTEVHLVMTRVKLTLLSVFAVVVVCAVSASAASAAIFELTEVECKEPKTTTTICWATSETGPLLELKGTQTFAGVRGEEETGEETLLLAKFGELEVHINCTGATSSGTVSQLKPLEVAPVIRGKIVFTGCKVLEPTGKKCKSPETLETLEIEGTAGTSAEETVFAPAPESKEKFIEFALTNSTEECPPTVAGNKSVTGTQICNWPNHATDLLEQLLWCLTTGSKLKYGGNAAEFLLDQTITLTGLEDWWDIEVS